MQPIPNTVDWSATAAWIALAISIITPTVSLVLNNIHQQKLKRLELKYKSGVEHYHLCKKAYEEFINNVSPLVCTGFGGSNYNQSYRNLFLYVPARYWKNLQSLDQAIEQGSDNKKELLDEVIKILATLLQKQQTQIQELACIPGLLASIRNRLNRANKT